MMHHLVSQEQDSPQAKLIVVEIGKVLERWTKAFEDQDIVVRFHSKPMYGWNTSATGETLVHLILMLNMRVLHLNRLKFDCDILF